MIAPKSARKNPTMGQIDETVIEAGARQAYQSAVVEAQAHGVPPPPPPPEPKYNVNIDARQVTAAPVIDVVPTVGLLGMVKKIPWYMWVAGGFATLFVAAVVGDATEKPIRTKKNRAETDPDWEDSEGSGDPDGQDEEPEEEESEDEDEESDDPEEDEEEDSEDEEEESDDTDDSEDDSEEDEEESEDQDELDDSEETEGEPPEDNSASRRREPASSRKKPKARERVIEDGQPEQEPIESAVE